MAAMRKEPKDIAELGPIGIVREALKLYAVHYKVFFLIQLALMLPLAILLLGAEYFVFAGYGTVPHGAPRFLRAVLSFLEYRGDFTRHMLLSIAASLVFQAVVSLSHSTTLYSVGLHYAGRPVSFVDALSAVTPRLWMRLALTAVYVHVLSYPIVLLSRVESLFLQYFSSGIVLQVVSPSSAVECLHLGAGLGIGILLMMSSAVSVLEEDYGWAAMKKGLKLLQGKGIIAILFQVLWIVPAIVEMCFGAAVVGKLKEADFYVGLSPSALALFWVTVVAFLAWTTLLWEIGTLCAGVQYVSFKAYHDESLSDSLYEKRTILVDGCERFGYKSNVALLKGALVKGNVV